MFQLILTQTHCVGEYLKWGGGLGLIHQSFRSCLSFVQLPFELENMKLTLTIVAELGRDKGAMPP